MAKPRPVHKPRPVREKKPAGVVLAYISPGETSAYFTESLLQTVLVGYREGWLANILQEWSSANVSQSRNIVTQRFLDRPEGEWLLWIDADMQWQHDAIDQLLAVADPIARPIVGGLCFGMMNGELFPTIYQWAEIDGDLTTVRVREYEQDAVVQVAATGAAFLLIHRSALEKIGAREFSRAFPYFQETELSGKPVGEDLTFCIRAGLCKIPVFVHTGVRIGHHKSALLTEDQFLKQQPTSLDGVGMVIPTRGDHPELLRAIIATSGLPPEHIVVVDTGAMAYVEDSALVLDDHGPLNIHRWWNRGIDALVKQGCSKVAILNDDVTIAPDTLPKLAAALGGAAMAVPGESGTSGHCFMLRLGSGVRPDESYRWWCGDLQLWADAADAGGVARVPDAWCLHLHANEATEASPELAALADADGELYDSRHAGTPNERIIPGEGE